MTPVRKKLAQLAHCSVAEINCADELVGRLGLDSLDLLRVLASIELEYDVTLPEESLDKIRTVGQLEEAIGERSATCESD